VAMEGRITVRHLERISPLAIPMILEIARESVSRRESGEYYLEELQKELLQETGLAAE
jgi:Lhr-like helicase